MDSKEEKSSSGWLRRAKVPNKLFAIPVVINEKEIVISPYGKNETLRLYNIENDTFSKFIPYPTEMNIKFHTIACDRDMAKIYLYAGSDKIFVEFDIHKQVITKCKKKKAKIVGNGKFSTSLIHNNTLHVIGGTDKERHLVWSSPDQKFNEVPMLLPCPAGHSSILLNGGKEDLNPQIIVLGGNENVKLKKYLDTIYVCDIHPEIQWKKLRHFRMPHRQYFFGCILYGQRIFIFGGKQKHSKGDKVKNLDGLSDEIWILNLKNWKWTRCHLKCPKKAKFYAVKTDSDRVHLFEYEGQGGHWQIPIARLINQESPKITGKRALSNELEVLSNKLTAMNTENEELKTSQKEYKQKIKALKAKNKALSAENDDLREEIEELKNKQSGSGNIRQSLLKANNDYNELNRKYQQLQAMNKKNAQSGTNSNNNAQSNPFEDDSNPFGDPFGASTNKQSTGNNDYEFWSTANILSWLGQLQQGRYSKYLSVVRPRLMQRNVNGKTFVNFKLNDLKGMGVNNYQDAVALLQHIKLLKDAKQSNNAQQSNTKQDDFLDAIFN